MRSYEKRCLAEGEGFEPSIRNFRMPPFQGGTINHSAILPRCTTEALWYVSMMPLLTEKWKYTQIWPDCQLAIQAILKIWDGLGADRY